jgi:hypothetical protein
MIDMTSKEHEARTSVPHLKQPYIPIRVGDSVSRVPLTGKTYSKSNSLLLVK